jgi:hypothetical protein
MSIHFLAIISDFWLGAPWLDQSEEEILVATPQKERPSLSIRSEQLPPDTYRVDETILVDGFVESESGSQEDTNQVNIWVAKVVAINVEDKSIDVLWYATDKTTVKGDPIYYLLEDAEPSSIMMDTVLLKNVKLNKNNTIQKRHYETARQRSINRQ